MASIKVYAVEFLRNVAASVGGARRENFAKGDRILVSAQDRTQLARLGARVIGEKELEYGDVFAVSEPKAEAPKKEPKKRGKKAEEATAPEEAPKKEPKKRGKKAEEATAPEEAPETEAPEDTATAPEEAPETEAPEDTATAPEGE